MQSNISLLSIKPAAILFLATVSCGLPHCRPDATVGKNVSESGQAQAPLGHRSTENPSQESHMLLVAPPMDDVPEDQWTQTQTSKGTAVLPQPPPAAPEAAVAQPLQPAVSTPPKAEIPADYRPGKAEPFRWVKAPGASYSILATEVTVAQFFECVGAKVCDTQTITPTSEWGPTCNYGRPDFGRHPINCINYMGAEQVCRFAEGRICTDQEWLSACAGPEQRPFPYGPDFDLARCNMQGESSKVDGRPLETAPVRSYKGCVGGIDGLWDMSGNVNEWVNGCKGNYCKFLGGGYMGNDPVHHFNSCSGVCAGNQKEFSSATIGVRCCRDS